VTNEPTEHPPYPEGSIGAYRRTSGTAIASLVCGIAAFFVIPIIGSIAAIILGYGARKDIARTPELEGEGFASAGIILGWIGIALFVLFIVVFVGIVASGGGSDVYIEAP
jgi:hypothetical protein